VALLLSTIELKEYSSLSSSLSLGDLALVAETLKCGSCVGGNSSETLDKSLNEVLSGGQLLLIGIGKSGAIERGLDLLHSLSSSDLVGDDVLARVLHLVVDGILLGLSGGVDGEEDDSEDADESHGWMWDSG
ncbi:hypothetical protein PFISCL1PPCAC_8319, partial [Pristionchus fissidentatus]